MRHTLFKSQPNCYIPLNSSSINLRNEVEINLNSIRILCPLNKIDANRIIDGKVSDFCSKTIGRIVFIPKLDYYNNYFHFSYFYWIILNEQLGSTESVVLMHSESFH